MGKQKIYITPEEAAKGYPSRDTKNTELVIADPVVVIEEEVEEEVVVDDDKKEKKGDDKKGDDKKKSGK